MTVDATNRNFMNNVGQIYKDEEEKIDQNI